MRNEIGMDAQIYLVNLVTALLSYRKYITIQVTLYLETVKQFFTEASMMRGFLSSSFYLFFSFFSIFFFNFPQLYNLIIVFNSAKLTLVHNVVLSGI